jgi:hypothetical protein
MAMVALLAHVASAVLGSRVACRELLLKEEALLLHDVTPGSEPQGYVHTTPMLTHLMCHLKHLQD